MQTQIYFIRHAQSHPTSKLTHQHWPLSDLGRNQATRLATILESVQLDHVICSPFIRCRDTVGPLVSQRKLPFSIHEDLRERCVVENLVTRDEFDHIWIRSWEDFHFKMPGTESSHEAKTRFVAAMDEIVETHPGKTIGVSTHGNVLALFLHHIDEMNHRETAETIRNPDIIKITHKDFKYTWDRTFKVDGLDELATFHHQTPMDYKKH